MAPEAIGAGTLTQLAKLPTGGCPVLSVYLDLDGDGSHDVARGAAKLEVLLGRVGQDGANLDIARVRDLVRTNPALMREARGLAIFSSARWSVQAPHPLVRMKSPHTVRGVTERLLRAHRRRPFTQLVIVARGELRAVIEDSLDEQLKAVQVGIIAIDLENASPVELSRVATPLIEGAERARERALLVALDQSLEVGGAAVVGPDDVLAALEQRRVEVLLILQGSGFIAGGCPRCGCASTTSGRCKLDGASLASVDAIEHAVGLASDQAAKIVVVRHERADLAVHGSIAALLSAPCSQRAVPSPASVSPLVRAQ